MSVSASQVQKIMRASVWAKNIATGLMILTAPLWGIGLLVSAGAIHPNISITIDRNIFPMSAFESWPLKFWAMLNLLVFAAVYLGSIYLLRCVFSNLARGEIFCAANVRHMRGLGMLMIAGGVLAWLLPVVNPAIFAMVGYDSIMYRPKLLFPGGFKQIYYGGIVILLSWIMDVGLGVREDAEDLKRDTELVI